MASSTDGWNTLNFGQLYILDVRLRPVVPTCYVIATVVYGMPQTSDKRMRYSPRTLQGRMKLP